MISVYTKEFGLQHVKPLPAIWKKYLRPYSEKNTLSNELNTYVFYFSISSQYTVELCICYIGHKFS